MMNDLSVDNLLGIKYLNLADINLIFNTADNFKKIIKIKMPFRKTFEYIYENQII